MTVSSVGGYNREYQREKMTVSEEYDGECQSLWEFWVDRMRLSECVRESVEYNESRSNAGVQ